MCSELRRVADVVDAGTSATATPGRLPVPVLHALAALVPCDTVVFNDLEPGTGTAHVSDCVESGQVTSAPLEVDPDGAFWRHYPGSKPCSYPTSSGDDRTVTLRSDFCSTREWKQSPMYVDVISAFHGDHEMLCPLPLAGGRSRRVLFFRSGTLDFTDQDRFALALLRPHLTELVGRRAATSELTERQSELMRLVAEGRTNAEIAAQLHLSPHTVRTHLENAFARLGVTTRAAAVAKVFA